MKKKNNLFFSFLKITLLGWWHSAFILASVALSSNFSVTLPPPGVFFGLHLTKCNWVWTLGPSRCGAWLQVSWYNRNVRFCGQGGGIYRCTSLSAFFFWRSHLLALHQRLSGTPPPTKGLTQSSSSCIVCAQRADVMPADVIVCFV